MKRLPMQTSGIDVLTKIRNDRWYWHRSPATQARPYDKPLPYQKTGGKSTVKRIGRYTTLERAEDPNLWNTVRFSTRGFGIYAPADQYYTSAHNKALAKVDDKLRTADSFFEDWYERQQAVKLLASSGKAILNFLTGWKNPKYWKHLAKESKPKDLPSAWLAYQFGVKPLVGGIDRALNLLSVDFPVMNIHGTSGFDTDVQVRDRVCDYPYKQINTSQCTSIVKIGCKVTGVNPNRALSGATGLNEPFSSVWNVLPWGWAVDYFLNVGQLLSNMENKHPGVYVEGWYSTTFDRTVQRSIPDWAYVDRHFGPKVGKTIRADYAYDWNGEYYRINRKVLNSAPHFKMELKLIPLGGNKMANLFSAIALTMSGKKSK